MKPAMSYKDAVAELKKFIKQNYNLDYVPYEKAKKRKETDALIRGIVINFIDDFMDLISVIQAIAIQAQMIMIWSDLDILVKNLKDVKYLLNEKNTYEGSTFFISSKNAFENFELMVQSEQTILTIRNELNYRLTKYKEAIDSALLSDSSNLIGEMIQLLKKIGKMWKIRSEAIQKYRFIK